MEVERSTYRRRRRPWRSRGHGSRPGGRGAGWREGRGSPHPALSASSLFVIPRFPFGGLGPYYDRFCRSAAREKRIYKSPPPLLGSGGAATMALQAACSGIANTRLHTPEVYWEWIHCCRRERRTPVAAAENLNHPDFWAGTT